MNVSERRSLVVGLLLGSLGLYGLAAVSIPNTFSAGTPIKASEVNANFSAVKTAVDALEAKINAGSSGQAAVQTDATLLGDGSSAARLGVKLPLALAGSSTAKTGLLGVNNPDGLALSAKSQTGDALSGVSQSGTGLSVSSVDGAGIKTWSANGFALEARGNVSQNRDSYGLPKAMVLVRVNPTGGGYEIVRCFNAQQTGALVYTSPCGFSLSATQDSVSVDFRFNVLDRFVNLTSSNTLTLYAAIEDTFATSTVVTAKSTTAAGVGGGSFKLGFSMIVY